MEKNIPEVLIEKLKKQYNEDECIKIIEGLKLDKKTTLRINKLKTNKEEILGKLTQNKIEYSTVNWYEDAIILENSDENKIREFDIYKDGKIYLQSLSSMIPALVLEPKEKENILDMCAAPRRKNNANSCNKPKQDYDYCL